MLVQELYTPNNEIVEHHKPCRWAGCVQPKLYWRKFFAFRNLLQRTNGQWVMKNCESVKGWKLSSIFELAASVKTTPRINKQ